MPALLRRRPVLIAAALLAVLLVAGALVVRARLIADLPDVNDLSAGLHVPSIRITDRRGRLLYEVIGEQAGRHSVIALEDVPQACIDATIATEDANFYRHPGVDPLAVLRAVWINLRGGEVISGGSTITQQVARNVLLNPQERAERTLERKLRESILAYRLARRYERDDILTLYLNQTYYGNLAYGIDAAARAYFGKPVGELGLAECALLAGLPQAPALYDPLTDPEAAAARQSVVLGLMVRHGYIDEARAAAARREPLAFAVERYRIETPHFVMAVYDELQARLPPEVLYAGGLEVRTTLDLDWQHTAERIARRQLERLNTPTADEPPHNATGAALVALDPHTGQVLTMLGSPDYFNPATSGAINMALAPRQPGSTLKPFTYALAFDPDQPDPWTPATMLLDVSTSFVTKEGYAYTPVNYDRKEHGPVLIREALASSYNIPAVIALEHVGVNRLLAFAGRLGMTTLNDPEKVDLSLTLGGGDVRLLELAAAYAAFANGGRAVSPVMILDVKDASGETIYSARSGLGGRVIDERVAWLISDILSDNNARAPAFTTHSILQIGRPAAVKTGTTTDFRDNWTVGYTPNLVVGVWVGNADNSPMLDISGVSGAGPIWHHFMRTVLRGQPELGFERPDGLVRAEVCALSGRLPTPDCPHTRREWFIEGTEPTEYDTIYRRIEIDTATGLPADGSTPPDRRQARIFLDLPPQAHDWARQQNLPLLADLPHQSAAAPAGTGTLIITAPDAQTIYRIDPSLPLSAQQIRIVAAGPPGLHDVALYVDDRLLGVFDAPPFEAYWMLEPGEHTVRAEGIRADGQRTESAEVPFRVNPP